MSGATTILAAAAVAGTAYSIYAGERAAGAQKEAQKQAVQQAQKQEVAAEQAFNKANAKKPDLERLLSQNDQAAQSGVGSTMLTGPAGVDPATLALGKSTLLGG